MHRRQFLRGTGAAAAALGARALDAQPAATDAPPAPRFAAPRALAPIRASADRIVAIGVCTRPFRAQGPRIEAERIGRQTVVHNYGHGGAGWSLSWGAAEEALRLVQATRTRELAVIGCGAIGLTTAVAAQRAGLRVRIYARERPPEVASALATGVWSPDSRICTLEHATLGFEQRWEAMARTSFHRFQTLLGLPGEPVAWFDGYQLSDVPFEQPVPTGEGPEPDYPRLESRLLGDLMPRSRALAPAEHPFPVRFARRYTSMMFNLGSYMRLLMDDFLRLGGELHTREFQSPRQFAGLRERVLVNATGYGARALLADDSIVPVRGQTARLIPQPEVNYGLAWRGHNLSVTPRRDGLLVQAQSAGDFGNADATPNRAASEAAVAQLARLFV